MSPGRWRPGPGVAGAASGSLAALALPPFHLWPLAFVALVPLVRALGRPRTSPAGAVRAGLAFGAAFYLLLAHWLPATLHGLVPGGFLVGAFGLLILVGIAGLQASALHVLLRVRWGVPILALPAVWVTAEALVARAGPVAFPWTPLGLALAPVPALAGPAELGGVSMLTLWICLVNGWIAGGWRTPRAREGRGSVPARAGSSAGGSSAGGSSAVGGAAARPAVRPAIGGAMRGAILLALVALPAGWSVHRAGALPVEALASVDLVQIHLPRDVLLDRELRDGEAAAALERVLRTAPDPLLAEPDPALVGPDPFGAGPDPDLAAPDPALAAPDPALAAPDTVLAAPDSPLAASDPPRAAPDPTLAASGPVRIPLLLPEAPFASSWDEGVSEWMARLARARGAPVAAGTRFREDGRDRNGVIVLDGEGREVARHGKVRLVPAAEWPGTGAGPDRGVLQLGGMDIATLICFEMGFGSRSRALVARGADLLWNPTLDGWLRPAPVRTGSRSWSAPLAQHRSHLVLRAVEARRGAVRSSVSGELLVVDPAGRVREQRPAGAEGVIRAAAETTGIRTWFVRFGDLGAVAGILMLAVVLGRSRWPGRVGSDDLQGY